MTTYLSNYKSNIYKTDYYDIYNGVLLVETEDSYGTGTLLYDGRTVLTAAHLFDSAYVDDTIVYFDTPYSNRAYEGTVYIHDDYDPFNNSTDLALIRLNEHVLPDYTRFSLYRQYDEIGQVFSMVGYGTNGTGDYGAFYDDPEMPLKLYTQNRFDTDMYTLSQSYYTNFNWNPEPDEMLAADFDDGSISHDTIGYALGLYDNGLGVLEGMIASGDSGGPALINDKIAGVASYITKISETDNNYYLDSSFGELGAWQRVSTHQEWIDKFIRNGYENAPKTVEDVEKTILEGSEGDIAYTYFLLQFTSDRAAIDEPITLTYTTRDGTAKAWSDYIPVYDTVTIYQDETSVVIPVEILGDDEIEEDEIFYLDVMNPSHGSFGEGVEVLTAARTIINDDFL